MARELLAIVNGPNLNLLGERDPRHYGTATLADIEESCARTADGLGFDVHCFQSNHEGAIVDELQRLRREVAGIVINAAAYTHTSVAIRDALDLVRAPYVEVHLSDIHAREGFRRHSYLSDGAVEVIAGEGAAGYDRAVRRLAEIAAGRTG